VNYQRVVRAGLSALAFVLAWVIGTGSLPTVVLLAAYGVVFGVLAADPAGLDRQTTRRVGYTAAGLGGLGLYVTGTRNDVVVLSLVLGVGGLADSLLGWYRSGRSTDE